MNDLLLVLDMQNDLVNVDGPGGKSPLVAQVQERGILGKTAALIAKARGSNVRVGYVRVGFSPDYKECPAGSQVFGGAPKAELFKLGSWGTEIHPDLTPAANDLLVTKHRVSPFYQTNLEVQLKTLGIGRIFCCGVSTQAVVQATARDGHDRDYDIVVVEDCCAAHSEQEHANSMASIARFCRAVTSDALKFGA